MPFKTEWQINCPNGYNKRVVRLLDYIITYTNALICNSISWNCLDVCVRIIAVLTKTFDGNNHDLLSVICVVEHKWASVAICERENCRWQVPCFLLVQHALLQVKERPIVKYWVWVKNWVSHVLGVVVGVWNREYKWVTYINTVHRVCNVRYLCSNCLKHSVVILVK